MFDLSKTFFFLFPQAQWWSCWWTETCSCVAITVNGCVGWKVHIFVYTDIVMTSAFLTGTPQYMIWSFYSVVCGEVFSADEPSDCIHVQCFRECVKLWFSQQCCRGCKSSRVWCCVIWYFLIFQKDTLGSTKWQSIT